MTLIEKIHNHPAKAVLAITGGGTEAISELLTPGGGSRTVLEAIVPYSQQSFIDFAGVPDKFASSKAARMLAMGSYQRALKLSGDRPVIGVGATCSLSTPGEREGRTHRAFVAVQTETKTCVYSVDFGKFHMDRHKQERCVADIIIDAIAFECGILDMHPWPEFDVREAGEADYGLLNETLSYVHRTSLSDERGHRLVYDGKGLCLFPGSFNPLHECHLVLAEKAHALTGKPVNLELSVCNVDKPSLDYIDIRDRTWGVLDKTRDTSYINGIILTRAATFLEKAKLFPGSTFLIGWDTFKRLNDPKYYGGIEKRDHDLSLLSVLSTRFLVFHRIIDGVSTAEEGTADINFDLLTMSQIIPPSICPPSEMSSTELRKMVA